MSDGVFFQGCFVEWEDQDDNKLFGEVSSVLGDSLLVVPASILGPAVALHRDRVRVLGDDASFREELAESSGKRASIRQRLGRMGFAHHPVQGDGHCLFRALSLACFGREDQYMELRHRVFCHLEAYQSSFKGHTIGPVGQYIATHRAQGDSSYVEILAACQVLHLNAVVVTVDLNLDSDRVWPEQRSVEMKDPPSPVKVVYLLYHPPAKSDSGHFDLLEPISGSQYPLLRQISLKDTTSEEWLSATKRLFPSLEAPSALSNFADATSSASVRASNQEHPSASVTPSSRSVGQAGRQHPAPPVEPANSADASAPAPPPVRRGRSSTASIPRNESSTASSTARRSTRQTSATLVRSVNNSSAAQSSVSHDSAREDSLSGSEPDGENAPQPAVPFDFSELKEKLSNNSRQPLDDWLMPLVSQWHSTLRYMTCALGEGDSGSPDDLRSLLAAAHSRSGRLSPVCSQLDIVVLAQVCGRSADQVRQCLQALRGRAQPFLERAYSPMVLRRFWSTIGTPSHLPSALTFLTWCIFCPVQLHFVVQNSVLPYVSNAPLTPGEALVSELPDQLVRTRTIGTVTTLEVGPENATVIRVYVLDRMLFWARPDATADFSEESAQLVWAIPSFNPPSSVSFNYSSIGGSVSVNNPPSVPSVPEEQEISPLDDEKEEQPRSAAQPPESDDAEPVSDTEAAFSARPSRAYHLEHNAITAREYADEYFSSTTNSEWQTTPLPNAYTLGLRENRKTLSLVSTSYTECCSMASSNESIFLNNCLDIDSVVGLTTTQRLASATLWTGFPADLIIRPAYGEFVRPSQSSFTVTFGGTKVDIGSLANFKLGYLSTPLCRLTLYVSNGAYNSHGNRQSLRDQVFCELRQTASLLNTLSPNLASTLQTFEAGSPVASSNLNNSLPTTAAEVFELFRRMPSSFLVIVRGIDIKGTTSSRTIERFSAILGGFLALMHQACPEFMLDGGVMLSAESRTSSGAWTQRHLHCVPLSSDNRFFPAGLGTRVNQYPKLGTLELSGFSQKLPDDSLPRLASHSFISKLKTYSHSLEAAVRRPEGLLLSRINVAALAQISPVVSSFIRSRRNAKSKDASIGDQLQELLRMLKAIVNGIRSQRGQWRYEVTSRAPWLDANGLVAAMLSVTVPPNLLVLDTANCSEFCQSFGIIPADLMGRFAQAVLSIPLHPLIQSARLVEAANAAALAPQPLPAAVSDSMVLMQFILTEYLLGSSPKGHLLAPATFSSSRSALSVLALSSTIKASNLLSFSSSVYDPVSFCLTPPSSYVPDVDRLLLDTSRSLVRTAFSYECFIILAGIRKLRTLLGNPSISPTLFVEELARIVRDSYVIFNFYSLWVGVERRLREGSFEIPLRSGGIFRTAPAQTYLRFDMTETLKDQVKAEAKNRLFGERNDRVCVGVRDVAKFFGKIQKLPATGRVNHSPFCLYFLFQQVITTGQWRFAERSPELLPRAIWTELKNEGVKYMPRNPLDNSRVFYARSDLSLYVEVEYTDQPEQPAPVPSLQTEITDPWDLRYQGTDGPAFTDSELSCIAAINQSSSDEHLTEKGLKRYIPNICLTLLIADYTQLQEQQRTSDTLAEAKLPTLFPRDVLRASNGSTKPTPTTNPRSGLSRPSQSGALVVRKDKNLLTVLKCKTKHPTEANKKEWSDFADRLRIVLSKPKIRFVITICKRTFWFIPVPDRFYSRVDPVMRDMLAAFTYDQSSTYEQNCQAAVDKLISLMNNQSERRAQLRTASKDDQCRFVESFIARLEEIIPGDLDGELQTINAEEEKSELSNQASPVATAPASQPTSGGRPRSTDTSPQPRKRLRRPKRSHKRDRASPAAPSPADLDSDTEVATTFPSSPSGAVAQDSDVESVESPPRRRRLVRGLQESDDSEVDTGHPVTTASSTEITPHRHLSNTSTLSPIAVSPTDAPAISIDTSPPLRPISQPPASLLPLAAAHIGDNNTTDLRATSTTASAPASGATRPASIPRGSIGRRTGAPAQSMTRAVGFDRLESGRGGPAVMTSPLGTQVSPTVAEPLPRLGEMTQSNSELVTTALPTARTTDHSQAHQTSNLASTSALLTSTGDSELNKNATSSGANATLDIPVSVEAITSTDSRLRVRLSLKQKLNYLSSCIRKDENHRHRYDKSLVNIILKRQKTKNQSLIDAAMTTFYSLHPN